MKLSKKIKENIVQNFDWNTMSLLLIPLACLAEKMLYKHGYNFNNDIVFCLAITLLPMVATNYCFREDRYRFEKVFFIFFSLCSLVIIGYYSFFSNQPVMDKFFMWVGIGLICMLWILSFVFAIIWLLKNKQISAFATSSKKKGKVVTEWPEFIIVIGTVVFVNMLPI